MSTVESTWSEATTSGRLTVQNQQHQCRQHWTQSQAIYPSEESIAASTKHWINRIERWLWRHWQIRKFRRQVFDETLSNHAKEIEKGHSIQNQVLMMKINTIRSYWSANEKRLCNSNNRTTSARKPYGKKTDAKWKEKRNIKLYFEHNKNELFAFVCSGKKEEKKKKNRQK